MKIKIILFVSVFITITLGNAKQKFSPIFEIIENFDDGIIELESYPGEDIQPYAWSLDSINTYNNTPFSLKLYGNTWKILRIDSLDLDTNNVWQVSVYVESLAEIQGFGLTDGVHTLFYSFAGTEQLNIHQWVTVYQGAFPTDTWNIYQLPVGEDWLNWFGYLPTITGIVFINDCDLDSSAIVYFDEIIDITNDLPIAPRVQIWDSICHIYQKHRERYVEVQFFSQVFDPDSRYHEYCWYFGDDSTSNDSNPRHTYLIADDHEYMVLLAVKDSTNLWGWATCQVLVDSGQSTFPITINFVGDIMLARRYDATGGIINTFGIETIFKPTLNYLGNAAEISVANLESPLTNRGVRHPTKPIVFRGRPTNIAGLAYAQIDVVSLANNHIIDYGLEGMRQTQELLDSVNILYLGAGANAYEAYLPIFKLKKGINLGFLAFSDRTGQYDNYQPYLNAGYNKPGFANLDTFYVTQIIQQIKPTTDLIIAQTHSGSEYSLAPTDNENLTVDDEWYSSFSLVPCSSDIIVRHRIIDAGADLVINHHPHVIQGFEVYQGKLIAHSLGNFVFDLDYPETYPSVILNAMINQNGLYDYTVIPIYIDDYIPYPAKGELGLNILDHLAQYTKEFNTYLIIDRNRVIGQIILDTTYLSPSIISHSNEVQLKQKSNYWLSPPIKLLRNGSISQITSITPNQNWEFRLGRELMWLWFGNFEDEGASMWLIDQPNEGYDTIAYQGTRSLRQIRPASTIPIITNLEERIPIYSSTTDYTLYGYIKTQNTRDAGIEVRFYSNRTGTSSLGSVGLDTVINGTTNWTFYYNDFIPLVNTHYIDILMTSTGPQLDTSKVWFDNVGIIEWQSWQPFNNQVAISTPNNYNWIQIRTNNLIDSATISYQETKYELIPAIIDNVSIPNYVYVKSFLTYPNPSKLLSIIQYDLLKPAMITIKIYNCLGQEVRTLINEIQPAGKRLLIWDGKDNHGRILNAGIYFCQLQTKLNTLSRKIILLNKK
ncbi:MAG: CapA family protein [candidate division WOR-3 bacterium]